MAKRGEREGRCGLGSSAALAAAGFLRGCKVCARSHPWSDGGVNGYCVWCGFGRRVAVWNRGVSEDGGQFPKTSKLGWIEAWERRWRDWLEEGFGEIGVGCKDGIGGGGFGHRRMGWEPIQSVGVAQARLS